MKIKIFNISWILLLTAFTVYTLLDTFVLAQSYGTATAESYSDIEFTKNIGSYESDNISISVNEYRFENTSVYVADIQIDSSDYLFTALANNTYGKNVTAATSEIAESVDAILAINGDFYGTQESGYVIRNNTLYRNTAGKDNEDLVINSDGSFDIINESDVTAESLLDEGASDVLSFGPALVVDGEISVTKNQEVGKAMASNPRTAIGQTDKLHYLFVVSDGRTTASEGLSLSELAYFMQQMGCETAYNLDGGGSSTMYFKGEVINNPTSIGLGGGSGKQSLSSDSASHSGKGGGKPSSGKPSSAKPSSGKPSGEGSSSGKSTSSSSGVSERKVSDIVCIGE